jgi:hypothetical protein
MHIVQYNIHTEEERKCEQGKMRKERETKKKGRERQEGGKR